MSERQRFALGRSAVGHHGWASTDKYINGDLCACVAPLLLGHTGIRFIRLPAAASAC